MTYSKDIRWRTIVLHYVYGIDAQDIAVLLGPTPRTVMRWNRQFKLSGNVVAKARCKTASRWSTDVICFVADYAMQHPCFYVEELRSTLRVRFPLLQNTSTSTICRVLRFDLGLTRKGLESGPVRAVKSSYVVLPAFHNDCPI